MVAAGTTRRRGRRAPGDSGAASLDYVGLLTVVTAVVLAVTLAFTASSTRIGEAAATAVCKILTAGQGDCGGSLPDGEARQPTDPCLVRSDGDKASAGVSITFVEIGGERAFMVEELSNGQFRVTASTGADVAATAGVGGSVSFTVADNNIGMGASADIKGGVMFTGGEEWVVGSQAEVDRLTSAENWARFDAVVGGGLTGPLISGARDLLGIGETFPPADSVYIAAGTIVEGSAYAGYGNAVAQADGAMSQMLGVREDRATGNHTIYFETTMDASATATAAGGGDQLGAGLEGEAKLMTAVTLDRDGNLVEVSRSGMAAGKSSGLTNALFGGDPSPLMSESLATGTQWEAKLPIRGSQDYAAAADFLLSSGISPVGMGVSATWNASQGKLPGQTFMDAVRDRGELTRHSVEVDESVLFAGSGEVSAAAKLGLNGEYSKNSTVASDHQYWDGRGFADRTNC